MSTKRGPRFDLDTLRDLAGDRVLARGQAYFRDGLVEILDIGPGRVLARVTGSEEYRTEVTGQGRAIGGACSCPAFERDGFCKHMVAVALAANAATAPGQPEGPGLLDRIREHLRTRSVEALVETIVGIAERDPALLRKLEIAAAATGADDKALEARLKRAIRDATRTGGFVDYWQAAAWAGGADAALDLLAELASGPRAALVVELADYAVERIESAIEEIDDSDGHCGALLARSQEIHLEACRAARPDPVALARDLFRRETKGEYGGFEAAAERYADVLGEAGLGEYRRLAEEAWATLSPRGGPPRGEQDEVDRDSLMAILDFFAARDGDLETRIALRAGNLVSPWAYLQLAEFCRAHGREAEALSTAEEGLWLFEDRGPDERLLSCAVDLLLSAGRAADAEAHLWRAFEKAPSLGLYGRLRALGGEQAAPRAVAVLEGRLDGRRASLWESPADLLVHVMIEERMFEAAWTVVRARGASREVKQALAVASEATHPGEALAVYAEHVEELARVGGNPSYAEAAALIARMAGLRGAAEQATYLTDVKARHGRKRNLMKLLG
ncbi:Uncharacterized conserved protein, contains Zn finger domain [Tistlia consotensis]|uniref:Uncharacterized conserved protein, contains Zn finger domain n=1 Tax=Tistlia consotensis USBA 355 TaxID=560819 RepID=A0A1Y6BE75_9PROT|nr:DUF6880 family protein [Tistlia consotensis]SME99439.1 Uncharacterized conserved protein, contains Zn finger domain [Tistlia consotensis USBA 355]SNR76792.1 Uncharacterized conserved protein, contains Zn finger domain [Tistlia consotensis]